MIVTPSLWSPTFSHPQGPVRIVVACQSSNSAEVALSVDGGATQAASVSLSFTSADLVSMVPAFGNVTVVGVPDADNSDGVQTVDVACTVTATGDDGFLWYPTGDSISAWNR